MGVMVNKENGMTEQFKDDEIYPINLSAGGINAYYVSDCESAGHRPSYCICLNKIGAYERGALKDSDCITPIQNKICVALKMRKEEELAGKAIYFIHRDKLQAFHNARKIQPQIAVATSAKRPMIYPASVLEEQARLSALSGIPLGYIPPDKFKPAPKVVKTTPDAGTFADAISAAMREPEAPKTPTPLVSELKPASVFVRPSMLPGESLMAYAKRCKAAKPPVSSHL